MLDPVIRKIGTRPLFLGDRRAADPSTYDDPGVATYDHVLTLSARREPLTTHFHPLIDGSGNSAEAVDAALDTARVLHRADGPLLVHCAAGISRSSTVLAATLAAEEGLSFRDALADVRDHRREASPDPALREQAERYLDGAEDRTPEAFEAGVRTEE